jgi:hypothetical protein
MLHPTTQAIAESFGYVPFSEEEAEEQFQADISWDSESSGIPSNGSVYRNKQGTLRCYWKPSQDEEDLEGWYDIPSNEDIEEWSFDSICCTPAGDEVEPDHPDSWLSILRLI